MKPRQASIFLVALTAGLLCVGNARAAAPTGLATFAPRAAPRLDPFRKVVPARSELAQATQPAPVTPAPAAPIACTRDDQCPADTICDHGTCQAFEHPLNILLFRKEGAFTAFIPFYFSRRGDSGYRVIPPFYWHFWGGDGKTQIVFPFYWRFEDHLKQRVITVVPPYSHTRQQDAQSWAVWPIFYASTKFGWAAPLLLSFRIADPDRGNSYGLYGLLYFRKRNEPAQTAFDLMFPLFVSSRSPNSAFTFALPLNFYWRNHRDANLLVLPLFYRNTHPEGGVLATPLGYASTEGQNSDGSLLWLYWYGRSAKANHDVLFPLLWSFRGPSSSTTVVAPVLLHLRRGPWALTVFPFPLGFSAHDDSDGSAWKLFVPLFFWRSSDEGRSLTWITPFGGYTRDQDARTSTLAFLLLFKRRDPARELDVLFPLYWRYKNLAEDTTTRFFGPLYVRDDPEGATSVLFPVFWYFHEAASGATAHTLLPLYFRRSSPTETTTAAGVLPLWFYYRNFANHGWSAGLFPLVHFGRRNDQSHAVVFPLLWHFGDEGASTTVALPLFYRFADPHRSSTGIFPLLYFQGHDHDAGYRVQFPLFWRFTDSAKRTATTVVPPFFYQSGPTGWSAGLAPLLFAAGGGPRSHFVLFPFIWRFRDDAADKSTTVVLNYLHRRQGDEVTDALFPLLHYRRGARPGGNDETSFTLFPLVHFRRDATSSVFVTPIGGWGHGPERRAGVVLPYFWYENRSVAARGIPPLYLDVTQLSSGERTRVMGPFIQVDAPGRSARILFPIFGTYQDSHETGTYVFPTFFHRRTNDGYALDTFLPLFWRSRYPGHATTVVGPWFHTEAPTSSGTGLIPLYLSLRNAKRTILATPLFVNHENLETHTTNLLAALLFYRSTNPDGGRTVVFPLWWARDQGPVHSRVLFPLLWHFENTRESSESTLAGPLYWSSHGPQRTRGLLPIAWYSRDDKTGAGSNALMPLFYEHHVAGQETFLTLPFGFRRAVDHYWWYAGPLFVRAAPATSFAMLFPLWFSHANKVTDTQTTVIPPLLHFSRSSPERSLTGWLGLFWRHQTLTSSSTFILPLFYDVHSYHDSRTTLLVPLFLHHRNDTDGSAFTLAPLFYRRVSPVDSTTVLFPLIWDFNSDERRTTFVFPLFARFRRPTYTASFIFPNIYYRTGTGADEGTSRLFVFPLWESAVKRPGDYMWDFLLGFVGWERIGRNRFLKLLFFPFELTPAPAAQTAWYGRPPRPPIRRAQGVNTQVW